MDFIRENDKLNVLLVGNGISMAAGRSLSWADIIKEKLKDNHNPFSYEDISSLPANMQIIAASNNNVRDVMTSLIKSMSTPITDEQKAFYKEITEVPVSSILTTNYDYDIEQAYGIRAAMSEFRKCRRWTKDVGKSTNDKKYNLFQYSELDTDAESKKLWHIHGDICYKESMIMGHHYYGGLIYEIQSEVRSFFRRYNIQMKAKGYFAPRSWVDYFLLGDIFIAGLGFYPTEMDLWWLLDCKKTHFPETNVYFYAPDDGNRDKAKEILLQAYDVEIVDDIKFTVNGYNDYYYRVAKHIRQKCMKSSLHKTIHEK